MSGIRVNTGAKKIEVNDDGEYIVLNFGDQEFPNRYLSMIERIKDRAENMESEEKKVKSLYPDGSIEQMKAWFDFSCEFHKYIMNEVDAFFGNGTCRKVFGDIVPSWDMFDDFFTQLNPYFEKYSKERVEKLNKYNANRTGNV